VIATADRLFVVIKDPKTLALLFSIALSTSR